MFSYRNPMTRFVACLISAALVATSSPVPTHAASQEGFQVPSRLGRVTDHFGTSEGPQVILIQDLHLHYPTQKKIVKILEHLGSQGLLRGPIAIEGMEGPYDTTSLASYPSGPTKDRVVDYFMQKGELSGDEAFAVLHPEQHLYGVDKDQYYTLNHELYKQTLSARRTLRDSLAQIQLEVNLLKRKHYARALHRLDNEEAYGAAASQALLDRKLAAARTPLEQNLVQVDHSLGLLTRLLHQQVTMDETRYIAQRLPQFVSLTQKLLSSSKPVGPGLQTAGATAVSLEETIRSAVDFYAVALLRNGPMAKNTLALLKKSSEVRSPTSDLGPRTVVLITGGFHTAGLIKEFKKAGVGCTVITPQMDELPGTEYAALYERRVAGESMSFDQVARDLHMPATQALRVLSPWFAPKKAQSLRGLLDRTDVSPHRAANFFANPIFPERAAQVRKFVVRHSRSIGLGAVLVSILALHHGASFAGSELGMGIAMLPMFRLPKLPSWIDVLIQRGHTEPGSFTGQIATIHGLEHGATGVIAGHSETRELLGDSSDRVEAQLKAGFDGGARTVIHCVGESRTIRDQGEEAAIDFVRNQIAYELKSLTPYQVQSLIIAYEPLWAIKSKSNPSPVPGKPEDAEKMAQAIRKQIAIDFGAYAANSVRLLYGGSVDAQTVLGYVNQENVDGVLVGTASTKRGALRDLIEKMSQVKVKYSRDGGIARAPYFGANQKAIELEGSVAELADIAMKARKSGSALEIGIAPESINLDATIDAIQHRLHPVLAAINRLIRPMMYAGVAAILVLGILTRLHYLDPQVTAALFGTGFTAMTTFFVQRFHPGESFGAQGDSLRDEVTVPAADLKVDIAFGTSGWRGLVIAALSKFVNGKALPKGADGFTTHNVSRTAQAIADIVQKDENYLAGLPVGVGYDARPGGREFAIRVVEVLQANGVRVQFVDGVMATPVMAEMTRKELPDNQRFALGVHLTASHNPVYFSFDDVVEPSGDVKKGVKWMGIKVMRNGTPADDAYTGAIAARANDPSKNATYRWKALSEEQLAVLRNDAIELGNQRLADAFKFDDPDNGLIAKLNAVHDNGNLKRILWNVLHGGTSPQVQRLVEMMVAQGLNVPTEILNKRTLNEGSIADHEDGHPLKVINSKGEEEPWGPEPRELMYKEKMAGKMDAGVMAGIFDGDGDRAEVYDLDGVTTRSPNDLGVTFTHFLLKTGRVKGDRDTLSIVRTLPTTRNLDLLAKRFGIPLHQTPVGSKHFNQYMGSLVTATEESGHIFFRMGNEVFADSAVGEFLLSLLIVAETGKSLKQYYEEDVVPDLMKAGVPLIYNRTGVESKYVTEEFKEALKKLRTDRPQEFADAVSAKLGKPIKKVDSTTDKSGILVEFEDGSWAMYRLSGTDGSVRIYGEDTSAEKLKYQENIVQEALLELTAPTPSKPANPNSFSYESRIRYAVWYDDEDTAHQLAAHITAEKLAEMGGELILLEQAHVGDLLVMVNRRERHKASVGFYRETHDADGFRSNIYIGKTPQVPDSLAKYDVYRLPEGHPISTKLAAEAEPLASDSPPIRVARPAGAKDVGELLYTIMPRGPRGAILAFDGEKRVSVMNKYLLRTKVLPYLTFEAASNPNPGVASSARWLIKQSVKASGVDSDYITRLYAELSDGHSYRPPPALLPYMHEFHVNSMYVGSFLRETFGVNEENLDTPIIRDIVVSFDRLQSNEKRYLTEKEAHDFIARTYKTASVLAKDVHVTDVNLAEVEKDLAFLHDERFAEKAMLAFNGKREEAGLLGEIGYDPANRMGWWYAAQNILKHLLFKTSEHSPIAIVKKILKENPSYIILSGMGGSSLAIGTLLKVFSITTGLKIYTLDTTDPTVLRNIQLAIFKAETQGREWSGSAEDEAILIQALQHKTQAVGITKSATTSETLSHMEFFAGFGVPLWLLTDPVRRVSLEENRQLIKDKLASSKYVVNVASERIFFIELDGETRHGGRFSAPETNVPLLASVLMGRDVQKDAEASLKYSNLDDIRQDIFIQMAAVLNQLEKRGKDQITFIFPKELEPLALWLEQLVEESLGKEGKGLTIFFGEPLDPMYYGDSASSNSVFVRFHTKTEKPADENFQSLKAAGHATLDIAIAGKEDLMALQYGFARMVAAFAYLQKIVFVTQPSVQFYKTDTSDILALAKREGRPVTLPKKGELTIQSAYGSWILNIEGLIKNNVLTVDELANTVAELHGTMENAAAVYAAVMLLASRKQRLSYGEFALFGFASQSLRRGLSDARLALFNSIQKRAKVGSREQDNHSHEENGVGGKVGRFSTFLVAEKHPEPLVGSYSDDVIKASALGTVRSRTKNGGFAMLLMTEEVNARSEEGLNRLFKKAAEYLAPLQAELAASKPAKLGATVSMKDKAAKLLAIAPIGLMLNQVAVRVTGASTSLTMIVGEVLVVAIVALMGWFGITLLKDMLARRSEAAQARAKAEELGRSIQEKGALPDMSSLEKAPAPLSRRLLRILANYVPELKARLALNEQLSVAQIAILLGQA